MTVVAWNVNHRTVARRLTPAFLGAVQHIDCDVLFLSEYVAGPGHQQLQSVLAEQGLTHQIMTPYEPRQNQMLCACRFSFELADDWSLDLYPGRFNHLPIRLDSHGLTVIGHRIPEPPRRDHWPWILESTIGTLRERTLFIGDLNADPSRGVRNAKDRSLLAVLEANWVRADVHEAWSFYSSQGKTSLIDHALHTPDLQVKACLIQELAGIPTAGPGGISDHRPIRAVVETLRGDHEALAKNGE